MGPYYYIIWICAILLYSSPIIKYLGYFQLLIINTTDYILLHNCLSISMVLFILLEIEP